MNMPVPPSTRFPRFHGRTQAASSLPPGLDARSAAVLREIVEQYVATGEPVGSRTLARRLPMSLSPATIRNVMADLTDSGLLFAPHTSAGRLPTDQGLRLFVDGLLNFGELTEDERESISAALAASGRSLEDTLAEASSLLSGLSAAAGLVLAPKSDGAIRHIEFVPLGPGRALVVLVNSDGQVENRVIETPPGLPPSALQQASNYLNARLSGRPLAELRRVVAEEMAANRTELDALSATGGRGRAGDLDRRGPLRQPDRPRPGAAAVRRHPDRPADRHPGAVRAAGGAGNHAAPAGTGGAVGRRADLHRRGKRGVQHVRACRWSWRRRATKRGRIVGAIGVIGPTRINYGRIIPVVDYTARVIGQLLG